MAALCAYKNLIRNGFVDDANNIRFKAVGFVDSPAKEQLRNELYLLDMKMFEIYNPNKGRKEAINPTTLNQKISVLRAIRNAISHNCLNIQFNKLCDINDSKFVFELSEDDLEKTISKILEVYYENITHRWRYCRSRNAICRTSTVSNQTF